MREAFDPMETLAAGITKAVVRIKVVGVGGGGNSVLLRLSEDKIPGIELIAVNTDAKQLALLQEAGIEVLQIGERMTRGRGTGGVAEVGAKAAESDLARLEMALRDADLVFITAGMGGGVGTGADRWTRRDPRPSPGSGARPRRHTSVPCPQGSRPFR